MTSEVIKAPRVHTRHTSKGHKVGHTLRVESKGGRKEQKDTTRESGLARRSEEITVEEADLHSQALGGKKKRVTYRSSVHKANVGHGRLVKGRKCRGIWGRTKDEMQKHGALGKREE